jgi:uncharacterized membrane protein YdbT with pleckstrin-like domain
LASYIESNLVAGERVLHVGHVTWWGQFWLLFFGVILAPVVIGLVLLLIAWINVKSTELGVTNKRVIVKTGFISRRTVELNLQKVESVQVDQGFLGRMLNYGTVVIAGGGNPFAPLTGIADPLGFRRAFLEAQEQALGRAAPAPTA